jgi:hypothetical protein
VFLQAGDGHCHAVRQAAFLVLFGSRRAADPRPCAQANVSRATAASKKVAQTVAGYEVLVFEPSMLWTANRIGREGAHEAPVENVEQQNSILGEQKANIIFAYCSLQGASLSPVLLALRAGVQA